MSRNISSAKSHGRHRALTERLGLAADDLPAGGNWYPDDSVLEVLLDLIDEVRPLETVLLGGGLSVPVAAGAVAGKVTVLDHDTLSLRVTREMIEALGLRNVEIIEAELQDYSTHDMWYALGSFRRVPSSIDLLFIDGPGHFAGRTPRYPAGPELFPRLSDRAAVLLDDARRVKEKKALEKWKREFPEFQQISTKGGAVILRRGVRG